ncbi:MAG: hypothetical protein ACJ8FY_10750 [Gemmataceae bacterium]
MQRIHDSAQKLVDILETRLKELIKNELGGIYAKILSTLEILLGDIQKEIPEKANDLLTKYGYDPRKFPVMSSLDATINRAKALKDATDILSSEIGDVSTSLDLVFELRYGWHAGTSNKMLLSDIALALDHACEYNSSGKPSIWKVTK